MVFLFRILALSVLHTKEAEYRFSSSSFICSLCIHTNTDLTTPRQKHNFIISYVHLCHSSFFYTQMFTDVVSERNTADPGSCEARRQPGSSELFVLVFMLKDFITWLIAGRCAILRFWLKVESKFRKLEGKKPLNGKIYSGVCTFSQVLHIFLLSDWTRARSALLVVCFLKEKSALKQHLELSLSYKAGNFRLKLEVFSSSLLPWVRCHGNLCCRYEITTFWPISSPGNPSPFLEDLGVQTARESQVFVFIWWL